MNQSEEINVTEEELEAAKAAGRERAEYLFEVEQVAYFQRLSELRLERRRAEIQERKEVQKRHEKRIQQLSKAVDAQTKKHNKELAKLLKESEENLPEPTREMLRNLGIDF